MALLWKLDPYHRYYIKLPSGQELSFSTHQIPVSSATAGMYQDQVPPVKQTPFLDDHLGFAVSQSVLLEIKSYSFVPCPF